MNTVTVTDMDDSECWEEDYILDAKCDGILLYSDGLAWIPVGVKGLSDLLATTGAPGTATATTAVAQTTLAPTTT